MATAFIAEATEYDARTMAKHNPSCSIASNGFTNTNTRKGNTMALAKKKIKKKVTTPVAPAVKVDSTKTGETGTYNGYCVKCKTKDTEFKGAVEVSSNGRRFAKGPCPECGTKICRILGKA